MWVAGFGRISSPTMYQSGGDLATSDAAAPHVVGGGLGGEAMEGAQIRSSGFLPIRLDIARQRLANGIQADETETRTTAGSCSHPPSAKAGDEPRSTPSTRMGHRRGKADIALALRPARAASRNSDAKHTA